jgi:hypothetical protein
MRLVAPLKMVTCASAGKQLLEFDELGELEGLATALPAVVLGAAPGDELAVVPVEFDLLAVLTAPPVAPVFVAALPGLVGLTVLAGLLGFALLLPLPAAAPPPEAGAVESTELGLVGGLVEPGFAPLIGICVVPAVVAGALVVAEVTAPDAGALADGASALWSSPS